MKKDQDPQLITTRALKYCFCAIATLGLSILSPTSDAQSQTPSNQNRSGNGKTSERRNHGGASGEAQQSRKQKGERPTGNDDNGSNDSDESANGSAPSTFRTIRGPAVGASLGWEALYGNGAIFHLLTSSGLDFHGGLGYTLSGVRLGAGAGMNIFMTKHFAISFGGALSFTSGSTGKISLAAKFSPEAGGGTEEVIATKDYDVSSSLAVAPYGGILLALTRSFAVLGTINYNAVISGNEVTLKKGIKYDKDIQSTNEDAAEAEFNKKAQEQAKAGGAGFTLGALLFF
jgi:hypothetical protein